MKNRYAKRIRKSKVPRAIYIDFEGRSTDEPSSLLGVLCECDGLDQFVQFMFDPLLQTASAATGVDGSGQDATVVADLDETLVWLVESAKEEARTIVSWSKHDDEVIHGSTPQLTGYSYRNAIGSAKK